MLVLWINQKGHTINHGKTSPLTIPVPEAAVPDAVPTVVDMVAVFVLSLEAPVALIAVIILEVAEVETTTIEEVCVEGVVMTSELFVSERVVSIDSLGGIPVEMPKKIVHCQRFSDWIVLDLR